MWPQEYMDNEVSNNVSSNQPDGIEQISEVSNAQPDI